MPVEKQRYLELIKKLQPAGVTLVAVSKTKPVSDIIELYQLGQRDFGENYVQELIEKQPALPADINWHFIGHLQSNKVKYIASFVQLIHGVDSLKLLQEIDKQARRHNRIISVLLQLHIAREETKFGLDEKELEQLLQNPALNQMDNIRIAGLMGMASFSNDEALVRSEFRSLREIFDRFRPFERKNVKLEILSMGMSGDYEWALQEGSSMLRIGSLLFGARN